MITTEAMRTVELNDVELVEESRNGNREAFRQIIERYQTLVSSLAYCATGDVGQSEDLAQETFVAAWTELADLREPAKLRSWLCGIARFVIGKELRRQGREPAHAAESLEATDTWISPEPLPTDQAIGNEEKRILWRSLERIPEIYREPLVLFYREHQSIEAVARGLGLSEDAVKQRLSRGRKLLQEEFLAFVATALRETTPGKTFTLGVLAALPVLVTTATAATVTATATQGGPAAKATGAVGTLGAFLAGGGGVLLLLFGLFGFWGRWVGRAMGRAGQQTVQGRQRLARFWRTLFIGFVALVLPALLAPGLLLPRAWVNSRPWIAQARGWSIAAFCWLVVGAWVIWEWRRRRDARRGETAATESAGWQSYHRWVALGMIGPLCLLVISGVDSLSPDHLWSTRRIDEAETRRLISERPDARFDVRQYQDGSGYLRIVLPEDRRIGLIKPWDPALLAALRERGIAYHTRIEGKDFVKGGDRVGWLLFLSIFIVGAGTALLLRRPGTKKFYQQEIATPRAERKELTIIAVCAAPAMIGLSLLLWAMAEAHASKPIASVEARRILSEHPNVRLEVYQFHDGSKELWITKYPSRTHPSFTTPADEPTLALLTEHNLPYETLVQGRDFGYRGPSRSLALTGSFLLAAGGLTLLWWVMKRNQNIRRVMAVCAAVILIGTGGLLFLVGTSNAARHVSRAEARRMIAENQDLRFEVFQFHDGSKELWITTGSDRGRSRYATPAEAAMLDSLTKGGLTYETHIQGRDFGYLPPDRRSLFGASFILTTAAALLFWWALKKGKTLPAPAGASV